MYFFTVRTACRSYVVAEDQPPIKKLISSTRPAGVLQNGTALHISKPSPKGSKTKKVMEMPFLIRLEWKNSSKKK